MVLFEMLFLKTGLTSFEKLVKPDSSYCKFVQNGQKGCKLFLKTGQTSFAKLQPSQTQPNQTKNKIDQPNRSWAQKSCSWLVFSTLSFCQFNCPMLGVTYKSLFWNCELSVQPGVPRPYKRYYSLLLGHLFSNLPPAKAWKWLAILELGVIFL